MYTMIIIQKNGQNEEFTSSSLKKLQQLAKDHINELCQYHPNYTVVFPAMAYDRKNPANPRKRIDASAEYVKFHTSQSNKFGIGGSNLVIAYFIMNEEYDYISIRYTRKQG